jgi:hypothetical protein
LEEGNAGEIGEEKGSAKSKIEQSTNNFKIQEEFDMDYE